MGYAAAQFDTQTAGFYYQYSQNQSACKFTQGRDLTLISCPEGSELYKTSDVVKN